MSVNIHGTEYITVAERLKMAKNDITEVFTELLPGEQVIVRATVTLKSGKKATGISGANNAKTIEKASPYEVAETSAVGRALGFLGYGVVNGIASADEMTKAGFPDKPKKVWNNQPKVVKEAKAEFNGSQPPCDKCKQPIVSPAVVKYSMETWGKPVCFTCQKDYGITKGGEIS